MPSQACLNKIAKKPPPLNVPCPQICSDKSFINGTHCSELGLPTGEPFITNDPSLNNGNGGYCYCCCSCFAWDTPIEVSPSEFVMIQDIEKGDTIMATGADLNWKEAKVKDRSGGITKAVIGGLYLVRYRFPDETDTREILVTPDHLFMMSSQRTLKAVQHLIPGDSLTLKDGGEAEVMFVASGEHNTAVQTIEMEGDFDGTNLEGHLINANGVVTADYAVQVYYETGNINASHVYRFENDIEALEVGTKEYGKKFDCPELQSFLKDKAAWPPGFYPYRESLINVPKHANKFLTAGQAEDVQKTAKFVSKSIFVTNSDILRLFKSYRALYPSTLCMIDWDNSTPNAYAWSQAGQNVILITGGLARVEGLYLDAFSLILSTMQARFEGAECVGEADYTATAYIMRNTWSDIIYANMMPRALDQVKLLFSFISKKNAEGDPKAPCDNPSLNCRLSAFLNGLSFLEIPNCAKPILRNFEVKRASVNPALNSVTVVFTQPVEISSATSTDNYSFTPEVEIKDARVDKEESHVILSVSGMSKDTEYTLTATHIVSAGNMPLNPQKATVHLKKL